MSSDWTNKQLAMALACEPIHTSKKTEYKGVSIDSRTCLPGNIFVCIRGENTDAHLYIPQAIEAGATAIIVEEASLTSGILDLPAPGSVTVFSVSDCLWALQELSRFYRSRLSDLYLIAVSGSNGKTSCKEMLAGLINNLDESINFFSTKGNFNNHIGVPLSLLSMSSDTQYAIIEMGMNHSGEIDLLSKIARPDIALITNIAGAHIEFFNSIEDIALAKLEITSGLKKGAWLFWPNDSAGLSLVQKHCSGHEIPLRLFDSAKILLKNKMMQINHEGIHFQNQQIEFHNPFYFSPVMCANLVTCMLVLEKSGFEKNQLCKAASRVKPVSSGRFEVIKINRKKPEIFQLLIDDTYNANPDSFVEAIQALRLLLPEGRLAIVAGEMAELGNQYNSGHTLVAELAADLQYDFLAVCGHKSTEIMIESFLNKNKGNAQWYQDVDDFINHVHLVDWSGFDGILVKGSRSAKMEKAVQRLRKNNYV